MIIHVYAADWYSKAKFVDGVSTRQVGTFVETSFTKMRAELRHRGHPLRKGPAHAA